MIPQCATSSNMHDHALVYTRAIVARDRHATVPKCRDCGREFFRAMVVFPVDLKGVAK